ncbi:ABC transporter permease [Nocardiopsis valliformis]|uniref:ABC transporter permease n=1 Tax=Nocardiopsis valliformis TaxID=239974 RepID=UPI00037F0BBB|nr:FtsX-like permease family protein [Nocardiopsis valliformis]
MTDWHIIRRNLSARVRVSRAPLVFTALGVAFALVCLTATLTLLSYTQDNISGAAANRSVEIDSVQSGEDVTLDDRALDEIAALPKVDAVHPWFQEGFLLVDQDYPAGVLWATPRMEYGQPPLIDHVGEEPAAPGDLSDNEVVLPDQASGVDLSVLLGKTVEVEYTVATGPDTGEPGYTEFKVVGLYDSGYGAPDGPGAAYLSPSTVRELVAAREMVAPEEVGARVAYPKAVVEVSEEGFVLEVQRSLAEQGFAVSSVQSLTSEVPSSTRLLQVLTWALIAVVTVYCAGTGVSFGSDVVRNRRKEIGLLKAVGFSRRRVTRLLRAELVSFGLLTGVTGTVLGALLAGAVLAVARLAVLPELALPPAAPLLAAVAALMALPAVSLCAGSLRQIRAATSIPADDALRDLRTA